MRFRTVILLSLILATGSSLPSTAAEGPEVKRADDFFLSPLVDAKIRDLMQDRKYAEAVTAIDGALAAKTGPIEYLHYLKGRALYLDGRFDDAIVAYQALEQQFPQSVWRRRARFGMALSMARKGDFQSAERIFQGAAESLLSVDRKHELAEIYLQFADRAFQPAGPTASPDYQKALNFYQKALEIGPNPERAVEVELRIGECHQLKNELPQAAASFEAFVKQHPGHALEIEARYRWGQCQFQQNQLVEARRTWQDLMAKFADSTSERLREASFGIASTYRLPQPASDEELALGVAAAEAFIERFPAHRLASAAHLAIGQGYQHRGRHEDAVQAFQRFLRDPRYVQTPEVPSARQRLGAAYLAQKKFSEALATWREYLTLHPAHEGWSEVQRAIIDAEYLMAQEERDRKRYDEARRLWQEFLVRYPLEPRAAAIQLELGQIEFEQSHWDEAIAAWRQVVSKFPNSEPASQAQFRIALTTEEQLGHLKDALDEYRRVTWGSAAASAQQRIAMLTTESLTVSTERVFRTSETPRIKVTTRNIESLSVKAYAVDLETYFRKMHLGRGVEGLDIALIDPDKVIEFKVDHYERYRLADNSIEIPLPADATKGVMAVTVSGERLEATTLVVQSDLDMIVKCSRDEIFVFAENMLSGRPWPNCRLLLSDGQQVFAEAETGADGVFQQRYAELKPAADIRVFAIAEGSVASNVVGLAGVGVAQGLADKGYLYTDRAAYRPGQMVHVRGVFRKVAGDSYTVEEGKSYKLHVLDGRNRQVGDAAVKLNAFGSVHARFPLPADAPPGEYRIVASDDDGHAYQGGFTVLDYQLEPVRLSVTADRTVYFRGEEIVGKIVASYYYGAPLAGREIQYQLAGDRQYTATTNDQGEVEFKLPTREFREAQVLPLVVALPERNLRIAHQFFLATQGFSLAVSTVRPIYLAGESLETSITVKDAEGKPLGQKLTLAVLQQTLVNGVAGERQVAEYELEADAKTGQARKSITLPEGGTYFLRAIGIDRFQNRVSAQQTILVSDDHDTVRLRILSDQHSYKVGDVARVTVHWREQPALALLTFQGAEVLQYKLIELQTGENSLELPLTAKLAPNFDLAVAVMQPGVPPAMPARAGGPAAAAPAMPKSVLPSRFHEASSPFSVERDLRVRLEPVKAGGKPGSLAPGDPLEVRITTTDPQGKPVAAEVSLAMIEQALFERFGSKVAAIDEFFRGARRESAVRTTSSITFDYRPATLPINPQLLAERDRMAVEAAEAADVSELAAQLHVLAPASSADRAAAGVEDELARSDAGDSMDAVLNGAQEALLFDSPEEPPGAGFGGSGGGFGGRRAGGLGGGELDQRGLSRVTEGARPMSERAKRAAIRMGRLNAAAAGQANGEMAGRYEKFFAQELGDWDEADGKSLALGTRVRLLEGREVAEIRRTLERGGDAERQWSFGYYTAGGVQANVNFRQLSERGREERLNKLVAAGAVVLGQLDMQETAYWNPAIVTGADGQATVEFDLPERSTGWKLLAKGVSVDTLTGEASTELAVKKEVFGSLKLPLAFTEGDEADLIATIHNTAVDQGQLEVVFKATIGDRTVTETKRVAVTAKGPQDVVFHLSLGAIQRLPAKAGNGKSTPSNPRLVQCELTTTLGKWSDQYLAQVPLARFGLPVYSTTSGAASSDMTAWLDVPPGSAAEDLQLQIVIGASLRRSLLDIVLGSAPTCQLDTLRVASTFDVTLSDLLAAVALQKWVAGTRDAQTPEAASLDARIRSAIGTLVSAQNDDGGWSWSQRGLPSNRYVSARALWALTLAKQAGYTVQPEAWDKALRFVQSQVAATTDADLESKAVLLHALAVAGRGDFALANRLYRDRPNLSAGALVHVALALAEMDRKPMAAELLDLVAKRNLDEPTPRRASLESSLPWNQAPAELRALYCLAAQKVAPGSARAKELVDWLLAHRVGHRWSPDKATGPAALAVSQWFADDRFTAEHYQLTVYVNDLKVQQLDIADPNSTHVIDVPARLLKPGKQRINFQLTGRGRFGYQCMLIGFVPGDKVQSTTQDYHVQRQYEPSPLEVDGREIPRGFGIVQGSFEWKPNVLTELPVGRRGHVTIQAWRANINDQIPDEQLEYLVLTEPLPSGVTVVEGSVQGAVERYEISPGAITFYLGNVRYIPVIAFDVHGYLPGEYRAAPTLVRDAYHLGRMSASSPAKLSVLPRGGTSRDEYRLSPVELFELGKLRFGQGDFAGAIRHLAELMAKWNLQPDPYKETARLLLDAHLEIGPAAEVVRYFEIVKEKWPDLEIPFAKIVKVGAAYHTMGEYERSYLIFRATVEGSFQDESNIPGFIEEQGEFARSVEVMQRLLREYPPEPFLAAATYALAQRVYAKAPSAAADARLREAKITRVTMIHRAHDALASFLTEFADDPAADQAAFSAANALLDLKQFDQAIADCNKYADRYPRSDYLDSYWYVVGYCHFARGSHEQALEMCRKVAEAKRIDPATGKEVDSANKWRAIYILGQVYHSLGKAAEAIAEYGRVAERFADAQQAIDYFARKEIALPEVTTLTPGQAAAVELAYRNVAECDLRVYRIDLMKFSLLRRSLGQIAQINLAGIRPLHEERVVLGDGKDYRDCQRRIELPLTEVGAYLVVCRGTNLHTSGLLLVTPLVIDVQEQPASGRVRATVKTAQDGVYRPDVHVKVIGSRNGDFVSGATDLRGVFVADGIAGVSTVIAQAEGGQYAFFRGKTELGPKPAEAPPVPAAQEPQKPAAKEELLEELRMQNSTIQQKQNENLDRLYKDRNRGVRVKAAY